MTDWYVIGQAPAADGSTDLEGPSADKLIKACGATREEWLGRFRRVNLLKVYPGRHQSGIGDNWLEHDAAKVALELAAGSEVGSRFILLGRNVQRAFGFAIKPSEPFFVWIKWGGRYFAVVPHPSGVSRFWNSSSNWNLAIEFWRGVWQRSKGED